MSKQDPADQVKFLVSCIGNTTNGRPDFSAVASELGIVSKAAAQKRYERMLKANGVFSKAAPKSASSDDSASFETPEKKRKTNGAPAATPKRARKAKTPKAEDDDDDEEKKNVKPAKAANATKAKPVKAVKAVKDVKPATNGGTVKKEESDESGSPLSDPPSSEQEPTDDEI